ncbi:MoaD/ThiS family protein [Phenylobacterium sp.]|uniref:MoaD/ThiS family protein n=1 Tax=Phenylobacterium sp. TaxID=1871053 RepID=UPI002FDB27C5
MTRVLLFGPLRDVAGWRDRRLEPPPACLSELRLRLAQEDAALAAALDGPGVQVALNQALVRGDADLTPDCEVAFLPPMSGG